MQEIVQIDNNVRCTISGLSRLISFSNPFIAPKCQELSSNAFEIFFLNFFEYMPRQMDDEIVLLELIQVKILLKL